MPRLPGINHLLAIPAFEKIGFQIVRQSKHIIMKKDERVIVIPRANPIHPITMGGIIKDAGPTVDDFKQLL